MSHGGCKALSSVWKTSGSRDSVVGLLSSEPGFPVHLRAGLRLVHAAGWCSPCASCLHVCPLFNRASLFPPMFPCLFQEQQLQRRLLASGMSAGGARSSPIPLALHHKASPSSPCTALPASLSPSSHPPASSYGSCSSSSGAIKLMAGGSGSKWYRGVDDEPVVVPLQDIVQMEEEEREIAEALAAVAAAEAAAAAALRKDSSGAGGRRRGRRGGGERGRGGGRSGGPTGPQ